MSDTQLLDLRRGHPEPEERIDLHGLRSDAVPRILAQRLESAVARRIRCAVIIHGHGRNSAGGEAVLRDRLAIWLTRPPNTKFVLALAPAPNQHGGEGATLVLLKNPR